MATLATWPSCQLLGIFGQAGSTLNVGASDRCPETASVAANKTNSTASVFRVIDSPRLQNGVQPHGRANHPRIFAVNSGELQAERERSADRHRNRDGRRPQ